MSYLDIENRQGVRYRVRTGWYYPPYLPQDLAKYFVDLPLLQSFDDAVLEQVCQKFLGFAQALPDPTNPHYRRQFESTLSFDPYVGAPAFFSDPGKRIYLALAQQRLIIEENPPGEEELAEQQSQLLQKIRMALRQIIAQERAEAAQHAQRLAQESRVNRALIYTGAFFNGLWNAGVDLAKWAKEVNDVINPTQRLLRSMHASHRALQRSRENGENILTAYVDEHLKGEKRELVQALGFDPTAITQEQFDQAMEIADLVWESPALRADLIRFAKDYVNAQHAIELTNLSGSAAFEILFTIVLAAVTAGAGLAASAASQARHLAKFRKVGDLLMEFAKQVKKAKQLLRRSTARGDSGPSRSFNDLPVDEVVVDKSPVDGPSHPIRIEKSTPNPKADSPNKKFGPKPGEPEPNWGNLLRKHGAGEPPKDMVNPHAHHTVFKKGRGKLMRKYLDESKSILEKHDIDWYKGPENLGWAPNKNHSTKAAKAVRDALQKADTEIGTREAVIDALQKMNKHFADDTISTLF